MNAQQVLGVSVDSQFAHLAWIQTDRKAGGLGDLKVILNLFTLFTLVTSCLLLEAAARPRRPPPRPPQRRLLPAAAAG